ncbi:hypothetical protein [Maridesulfovibrio sp.]|uniref:hypothetical protein n=1 Tax=Maridesulfovibrio sp. TaxID=2795000 RepID=UPI002A187216|nr:hypothetical protein [Maridesulfovibrio sp.]
MKKLIPVLILFLLAGCASLKKGKTAEPGALSGPAAGYSDPYGFIDPTVEGLSAWLDGVISTSKSMREISKNFYLHNSTVYQKQLNDQFNKTFDLMLFDRGEYRLAVDRQDVELRDRLIKALLLVVQVRIDTDIPLADAEGESEENRLARENLESLKELAPGRVGLDIRDLGLSCGNLGQCIAEFEEITADRK